VLNLRVVVASGDAATVAAHLAALDGVTHVMLAGQSPDGNRLMVTADVRAATADRVLRGLITAGFAAEDITLERSSTIASLATRSMGTPMNQDAEAFIWAEVVGEARANARLLGTYLAAMAVAGVIGGFGVTQASSILIIGAMAVSPDLLPLTAACVALIGRRQRLFARAITTLFVGLLFAFLAAAAVTGLFRLFDGLPADFDLDNAVVKNLVTLDASTVAIAMAAGVAGMLAFETKASTVVGVAISVTTIPVTSYLGVALATGHPGQLVDALAVLLVNQVSFLAGGVGTLAVQRSLSRIASRRREEEVQIL
jgi:uncharacterized hydrophobic protein (TIGR00271 family)